MRIGDMFGPGDWAILLALFVIMVAGLVWAVTGLLAG